MSMMYRVNDNDFDLNVYVDRETVFDINVVVHVPFKCSKTSRLYPVTIRFQLSFLYLYTYYITPIFRLLVLITWSTADIFYFYENDYYYY